MSESHESPRQVVAIGASAGGLSALKLMLPHLPVHQGVAYILAQHLDPKHPSLLDRILQRESQLTVTAATDAERLKADHLYIIPPDHDGTVVDGALRLSPSEHMQGVRHTIDVLFQSIAKAYSADGIGVVLSGSGSDGTQGIRAIKAAEGLALVQDPLTADFTGMPSAIIQERLADVIAAPEQIGKELQRLLEWPKVNRQLPDTEADTFNALVKLLCRKTGVSFDQYKESTLRRRIERRRIITGQVDLASYMKLLRDSNTEADLLLQDTLISVTEFFRNPDAFEAIRNVIKTLIAGKKPGETIRVWIPGCASGEEAFSIAMVLADELEAGQHTLEVQIFATDIDERAINIARKSIYLKSALDDLDSKLVQKYFVATDGTVQIAPSIRDMVTFAKHDLMQDPPFSRLDLVSCRNVMIYFKKRTQERLIGVFHYVLNSEGYLVLGPSESTNKLTQLFEPVDPHAKVFMRREFDARLPVLPRIKLTPEAAPLTSIAMQRSDHERRMRDLVFDQYSPPAVLVDERFNVLHAHGSTRRFLQVPEGNISVNLIDMVVLPLRVELRLTVQKCEREQSTIRSRPVVLKENDERLAVTLVAIPLSLTQEPDKHMMVLFESQPLPESAAPETADDNAAFRVVELEQDLKATRDHLQTNIEQLEITNEELQSVNEEYQSTTEELQSANEELQTTNEEMQSTNEELSTVNEELRVRSDDLASANRDLESILNSAVSGIVVLDSDLRVSRYSAASREIFDLLPTSIGKPLIAVHGNVDLALLSNEIQRAITGRKTVERELELGDKVFLVRLIPQPNEDQSAGLLISFIDVTESLLAAHEARRLAAVLKDSSDAITVQQPDGRIISWNRGAEKMYGYSEAEALAMNVDQITPASERPKWQAVLEQALAGKQTESFETVRCSKDGHAIEVSIASTLLVDQHNNPYAVATTERDITPIRLAEAKRRQAEIALEARLTTAGEMAAGLAHELNQPVTSIVHFCDVALSIAKEFDPKRREELVDILNDAVAQSHRAGDIIRNLRRFLGRRESDRKIQAINDVIEHAAGFIGLDCTQHGVALNLNLGDNLPRVDVDESQIGQVLVNLVKNSLEAITDQKTDDRRISITSRVNDDHIHSVQITIKDTGSGLNEEIAKRLFEPFRTSKPNGLGMGLWISRSIIESHGGRLWADEAPVEGAEFHFSLPAAEEDQ